MHSYGALIYRCERARRAAKKLERLQMQVINQDPGMVDAAKEAGELRVEPVEALGEHGFRAQLVLYYGMVESLLVDMLRLVNCQLVDADATATGNDRGDHQYHVRVLRTLKKQGCPLKEILGGKELHQHLKKLKKHRNWCASPATMDNTLDGVLKAVDFQRQLQLRPSFVSTHEKLQTAREWLAEHTEGNGLWRLQEKGEKWPREWEMNLLDSDPDKQF